MIKAKSITFYPEKFLAGTMFFSSEQAGKYIRALCAQCLTGHLKKEYIDLLVDNDSLVMEKFVVDGDGNYYNEVMEQSVIKSAEYSRGQSVKSAVRWSRATPKNKTCELFKAAFPGNGSALNPEVENFFILHESEMDCDIIIERAGEYAEYWKGREPHSYPYCRHMKQAINWLRENQFEIDWTAKLVAEKQGDKKGVL